MENKYLSDGRKVVVVGKLNNTETIVQEIFVAKNGTELASGENFVVKSLHDSPVLSWKEKHLLEVEAEINNLKDKKEQAKTDYKISLNKLKAIRDILSSSEKLMRIFPEAQLKTLSAFMTGTIEYLVVDSYEISKPVKLIDKIINWNGMYGERQYDSIKLLSVLGKSKGEIEYRINTYSDGSGGSTTVYPFCTIEDAIGHIKNVAISKIEKGYLSIEEFDICKDLGIDFSDKEISKYIESVNAKTNKQIENSEKSIKREEDNLSLLRKSLYTINKSK